MTDIPPPPPPPAAQGPAGRAGPPLAELGPRLVAFLVDWLLPVVAYWVVAAVAALVSNSLLALWGLFGWLALIGFEVWNVVQEGATGQTVGKRMQGIRLVGVANGGRPVGPGKALVRALVNSVVCGVGWLLPFFDDRRQTLGDKVSDSVVVAG